MSRLDLLRKAQATADLAQGTAEKLALLAVKLERQAAELRDAVAQSEREAVRGSDAPCGS